MKLYGKLIYFRKSCGEKMRERYKFIKVTDEMLVRAMKEAKRRNPHIVHHFEVEHLTPEDRDVLGFLGEFCACELLGIDWITNIRVDYETIDSQDGVINGLKFDVKTETIPDPYFTPVIDKTIKNDEMYGRRLITKGQVGLLHKYDIVIFGAFKRHDYTKWYPIGFLETSTILQNYSPTTQRPDGGFYPVAGMPIKTSDLKNINKLLGD